MLWVLVALLACAAGFSAWREPRRLRVGVLAAFATGLALLGAFGQFIVAGSDDAQLAWTLVGGVVLAVLALIVLGVFSVLNGITVVRKEGARPTTLLPLAFGLLLLGYCALILSIWWLDQRHTDAALELFWWLAAIGLPLMYLAFVFVSFIAQGLVYGWAIRRWASPVDVVIVLGAGLHGDRVTPLLASRLDRGREVLDRSRSRGRDTRLICSGGQGADEVVPEAVAMANYLIEAGVVRDLLWLEDRSTSTEENLRFSAAVAAEHGIEGRFAVVTNNYHVLRAALLMRSVCLAGYGLGVPTARYFWPSATLREFAAILRDHRLLNGVILAALCLPLLALLVRAVG